jgi:hypothetical protein
LTVELTNERATETTFTLTNVVGEIVFVRKTAMEKGNQLVEVDMADLPKGMYLLTVENEVAAISHKVMKE